MAATSGSSIAFPGLIWVAPTEVTYCPSKSNREHPFSPACLRCREEERTHRTTGRKARVEAAGAGTRVGEVLAVDADALRARDAVVSARENHACDPTR